MSEDRRDFAVWDRGVLPLARALLRSGYLSLRVEGVEALELDPSRPIVYVANHSGFYSLDTLLIAYTIHEKLGRAVTPYTVTADAQLRLPWVGELIARVGGAPASAFRDPARYPPHVRHVGIFAEGAAGNRKPFWRAYRLEHFHTGFVRFALFRGATVVPLLVIGGEECAPVAFSLPLPGRAERLSFPVSPLPLPSAFKLVFLAPERYAEGPDRAFDQALCAQHAGALRQRMQAALDAHTADRPLGRLARRLAGTTRMF